MYAKIKEHKRVSELWADELIRRRVDHAAPRSSADAAGVWDELTAATRSCARRSRERRESGVAEPAHRGVPARPHAPRRRSTPTVPAELLRELQRGAAARPGAASPCTPSWCASSSAAARRSTARSTGRTPRRSRSRRCSPRARRSASPARTPSAAPSASATSCCTTPPTARRICPIQQLPTSQAPFELHNSPLSEIGCLGFEYGYSQESPETLVLWEAQFGDFVNAAQVIVDQFIVSGLAKWGQTSRLTLLLPHGYEGSGPEHSSARLERFLSLAAEGNLRIANPTTPAQYFHLLRRQAKIVKQRPLIVMTPKSLLRLPQATSRARRPHRRPASSPCSPSPASTTRQVTRLILCTGKIYYDLVGHPDRAGNEPRRDRPRRAALPVPRERAARAARRATRT